MVFVVFDNKFEGFDTFWLFVLVVCFIEVVEFLDILEIWVEVMDEGLIEFELVVEIDDSELDFVRVLIWVMEFDCFVVKVVVFWVVVVVVSK